MSICLSTCLPVYLSVYHLYVCTYIHTHIYVYGYTTPNLKTQSTSKLYNFLSTSWYFPPHSLRLIALHWKGNCKRYIIETLLSFWLRNDQSKYNICSFASSQTCKEKKHKIKSSVLNNTSFYTNMKKQGQYNWKQTSMFSKTEEKHSGNKKARAS